MDVVTKNVNLTTGTAVAKRAEIKAYFNATWALYERLFDSLASDAVFYEHPQPLRHPLIFYFGHTATFFINKLVLAGLLDKRVDPHMESLFAIGVDEMSWDDLNTNHYEWPTVDDVRAYRNEVRTIVNRVIDRLEFTLPIQWESSIWPIMMGIEHERIHLETSSVLIRQLPLDLVTTTALFPAYTHLGDAPTNALIPVNKGTVRLGKEYTHRLYGWDNEYGSATIEVPDFSASKFLVSNGEYLTFIQAGGYAEDRWWDEEGLAWRIYHQAEQPEFWLGTPTAYRLRLMTEEIPLPLNWPVEVCYLEAKAFCSWKSEVTGQPIRMPDEAEYRRLLEISGLDREHHESPIVANWNLEYAASSVPVDEFQHGDFFDLVGNVWQWNETPIYPFAGFKVHPLYDDFTVPTFDNRHNLIKGGSWISTGNAIALHSRYAFRRHFYQHAGFRYVVSDRPAKTDFDIYETNELVTQYCEFHYGDELLGVPNFSKAIAQLALNSSKEINRKKALDVGCSVGRTAFELAAHFESVDAVDYSARFIQVGAAMQQNGRILYERVEEGELVTFQERTLAGLKLNGDYTHIHFLQQDAMNMKPSFTGYDLVVAANLIDRVSDPARFLRDLPHRINHGGVLLIASPYTWLEKFTPKGHWLGGFKRDGEPVTSLDGLHALLDEFFDLIGEPIQLPFVIRETQHKYQYTLAEVTLWIKK